LGLPLALTFCPPVQNPRQEISKDLEPQANLLKIDSNQEDDPPPTWNLLQKQPDGTIRFPGCAVNGVDSEYFLF
jgi:hypothetical protein